MVCPNSGIKYICKECNHNKAHQYNCCCDYGCDCDAVGIVNCEPEIKYIRAEKLKNINKYHEIYIWSKFKIVP